MSRLRAARRLLSGIRQGVGRFMEELAQDLQEPRPAPGATVTPPDPVPQARRERLIETFQADYQTRAHELIDRLARGDIDLPTWRARMALEINNLHFSAAVSGAGGFGNLTPEDLARVETSRAEQVAYLNRWAGQLAELEGDYEGLEDQLKVRASLYGGAASTSYSKALIKAAGVPDLPFYPAEGTDCRTNCKCHWEITPLENPGDFDCFWRRSPVDSCQTCIRREAVASPLRIRGGSVEMDYDSAGTVSRRSLSPAEYYALLARKAVEYARSN